VVRLDGSLKRMVTSKICELCAKFSRIQCTEIHPM